MALGFSGYLIKTEHVRRQLWKIATGASILGISKTELGKVKAIFPKREEQQKIASFLGSVDEWVENLREQKKKLEEYKEGIMQKVFSQEIRFKDKNGKDFPDWGEKKLGEYIKNKSKKNKDAKFELVLSVSNERGFIPQTEQFEDHRVASKDTTNYKIVEKGDFAYNPSRINVGSIAYLDEFEQGIVSPMYVVFKVSKGLDNSYLNFLIQTHRFKYLIKSYSTGSVRETLSFKDMASFRVHLPSLPEQQKIADFLTSLDETIELKQQQISSVEEWKNGLMQRLFV